MTETTPSKGNIKADHEIDIKGESCPYTFVKSKLKIESIGSGEVLRIVTDHKPATENIPKSMAAEGHHNLGGPTEIAEQVWELYVKKR